jgi:glutathione S-transferase
MAELHKPPYEKISVNGKVPAIEDPNTGIALWESGAIVEYLWETYDMNNTLNYTSTAEKYLVKQWLHFQVSRFLY